MVGSAGFNYGMTTPASGGDFWSGISSGNSSGAMWGNMLGRQISNTDLSGLSTKGNTPGMNPAMLEKFQGLAAAYGTDIAVGMYDIMSDARRGTLSPSLSKGLASAKSMMEQGFRGASNYFDKALKEIGPASTKTQLLQEFAPALAEVDRMYAGRGVSGGQTMMAKQQLLDKMTQQGYAAQQMGSAEYGKIMGDLYNQMMNQKGALEYATYKTTDDNYFRMLDMILGGMRSATEPEGPGAIDYLSLAKPNCCFIFLEAKYGDGTLDDVVRRYRDESMTEKNRRGYYKIAEVLVPLMRESKLVTWLVRKTLVDPAICYGKWHYKQNKFGWIFAPVRRLWLKIFDIVGGDTKFIRESGEYV
jgi:hypothetical protein